MDQREKQTIQSYSLLWSKESEQQHKEEQTHFQIVQDTVPMPVIKGNRGLEIGCGGGHDIEYMATTYPEKRFVAVDFSNSLFAIKKRLKHLNNVFLVRASALELPFKEKSFDYVYSFGVLHHTQDPSQGMRESYRVVKDNAPVTLYLYENHENNVVKYYLLKVVTVLRSLTVMMPRHLLYFLCIVFSPCIYFLFSLPAALLRMRKKTALFANSIPFNFGRHPFHLIGDLFDRFATPIEERYGKEELIRVLQQARFRDIKLYKIPDTAGWISMSIR